MLKTAATTPVKVHALGGEHHRKMQPAVVAVDGCPCVQVGSALQQWHGRPEDRLVHRVAINQEHAVADPWQRAKQVRADGKVARGVLRVREWGGVNEAGEVWDRCDVVAQWPRGAEGPSAVCQKADRRGPARDRRRVVSHGQRSGDEEKPDYHKFESK